MRREIAFIASMMILAIALSIATVAILGAIAVPGSTGLILTHAEKADFDLISRRFDCISTNPNLLLGAAALGLMQVGVFVATVLSSLGVFGVVRWALRQVRVVKLWDWTALGLVSIGVILAFHVVPILLVLRRISLEKFADLGRLESASLADWFAVAILGLSLFTRICTDPSGDAGLRW